MSKSRVRNVKCLASDSGLQAVGLGINTPVCNFERSCCDLAPPQLTGLLLSGSDADTLSIV